MIKNKNKESHYERIMGGYLYETILINNIKF